MKTSPISLELSNPEKEVKTLENGKGEVVTTVCEGAVKQNMTVSVITACYS
jgi:hypothetical protein